MKGTRATGVEYTLNSGDLKRADAASEVIVSSGTFNSPQLLMLSGIGPAEHLRAMDIACVADLPVGKNLQDHIGSYMTYSRKSPGVFHGEMRFDRMALSMFLAYFHGTGPATVVPGGLHAFVKTRPELSVPDIEFMFRGTSHHPHLWFPRHLSLPSRTGTASGRRCCIPTAAATSLAFGRSARSAAHPLQLPHRAERSADAAEGLQARARARLPRGARSLSRGGTQSRRNGARPTSRSSRGCARR